MLHISSQCPLWCRTHHPELSHRGGLSLPHPIFNLPSFPPLFPSPPFSINRILHSTLGARRGWEKLYLKSCLAKNSTPKLGSQDHAQPPK